MSKRLFLARCMLFLVLFGILTTNLGWSAVDAQVADAEAEVYFQQILDQTAAQTPVFGPESADLPYEAYEDCPECTWAPGLSTTDVRVHVDLDWHGESSLPGGLFMAIRQTDPQALDVLAPNFITIMGSSWMAGSGQGELVAAPESVDVVATGNQGYLSINGELVTTFDLSGYADPGDVVLTAGMMVNYPGGSLGVENFTVWDLDATALESQDVDSSDLDVGQGVTGEDWEKFDQYRVMALFQPMIYGPESGSLAHDPASVSSHDAGVTVTDFMAHATCSVSAPAPVDSWDCGFSFRDLDANYYSIAVLSTGEWWISEGTNDSFDGGEIQEFQIEQPQSMTIELVAVGATGYLGVNDRYVATLDLSSIPGPGTVVLGSAFYDSTTVEGGTTNFEDFGVVSLDDMQGAWYGAPDDGNASQTDIPGVSGNTYTDATFPFSLTWDETWSVVDFANVDGTEMLTLTNGPVTADVYGAFNTTNAVDCLVRLIGYYQDEPGYSNVDHVFDQEGQPILSGDAEMAIGLITLTTIDEQGSSQEMYNYAACVTLDDGQSQVRLEQFVAPEEYMNQLDAMNALQLGLGFGEASGALTPVEPEDPAPSGSTDDVAISPDEAAFEQYITQTDSQTPVYGPAPAELVPSFRPDGTWEAGISLRDIRLHADIVLPDGDSDWGLMIAIRRGEVDPLITELMQDTNVILIDGSGDWETNDNAGFVLEPVASVDLIADGDDGYLAINGEFVTYVDMSLVVGPGEVVLAAITEGGEDSPLDLENVTIWDLDATAPAVEDPDSLQTDPAEPITEELGPAEDAAIFDQLRADALAQAAIYGPENGSLVHDADKATIFDAGVSVTNFAAHVQCEAPAGGAPPVWDCAIFFHDSTDDHLRLVVLSNGEWSLNRGSDTLLQSGEGVAAVDATGTGMTIDLVVSGDTGYFAVNSEFVSTLHVAEVPGPGTVAVATGLFSDTFAIGAETGFTDFTVWSLDEAVPAVEGASSATGSTYTSPTYGYSLTWDDTWTVNTDSSDDGSDFLSITNGRVTAELTAYDGRDGVAATACFERLMDKYLSDPAYSDVDFVTDELGQPLMTPGEHVASGLITFTITHEGGPPVELWDYVMCARMPASGTVVQLEQLVSPGTLMHEQSAMEWLQAGLQIVPEKAVSPPGLPDLSGVVSQPREEDISNFTQLSLTTQQPADAGGFPVNLQLDQPSESWWAAGVNLLDVWVRVELPEAPTAGASSWQFQVEYRAAGYGSDHVVVDSSGAWDAGQVNGTLGQAPTTIDLVALGETGYLAFDGTLVAMLNISTWMQPGDILLSAVSDAGVAAQATFEVANVSVWDMAYDEPPAGATAITFFEEDAAAFQDMLAQLDSTMQPVFGPTSGAMVHEPDLTSFEESGVSVANFAARIACLVPDGGVRWDCGFAFGNLQAADHYRIGIISDGTWFLSQGAEQASLSGTFMMPVVSTGAPVVVDLIVQDGTALIGANGEYVATIDVAELSGPGSVAAASAFFSDTAVAGGGIDYDSFTVWSLDETISLTTAQSGVGGNTYISPNFGYSLTWNDTWTVLGEVSEPGFDQITLTNGSAYADLYSVDLDVEATACNEDLFAYYASDPHYSDVAYLLDNAGNPLIVPGTDFATAWIGYTYTDDQGIATDYYDFAVCARLPDGSSMVQLELQASPADIEANLAAIEELAMRLTFDQMPTDILDIKGGGALVEGLDEEVSGGAVTGRGAAVANHDFTARSLDGDEDDSDD